MSNPNKRAELLDELLESMMEWRLCTYCDTKPNIKCNGKHLIVVPFEALENKVKELKQ